MQNEPVDGVKTAQQVADEWNAQYPVGTAVDLLRDSGDVHKTKTRAEAYVSNSGHVMCFFEGVSGCYLLSRATPVPKVATEEAERPEIDPSTRLPWAMQDKCETCKHTQHWHSLTSSFFTPASSGCCFPGYKCCAYVEPSPVGKESAADPQQPTSPLSLVEGELPLIPNYFKLFAEAAHELKSHPEWQHSRTLYELRFRERQLREAIKQMNEARLRAQKPPEWRSAVDRAEAAEAELAVLRKRVENLEVYDPHSTHYRPGKVEQLTQGNWPSNLITRLVEELKASGSKNTPLIAEAEIFVLTPGANGVEVEEAPIAPKEVK